jgi:hypothetical protein
VPDKTYKIEPGVVRFKPNVYATVWQALVVVFPHVGISLPPELMYESAL